MELLVLSDPLVIFNAGAKTPSFTAGIQRRLWFQTSKSEDLSAYTAFL
jgi:hypothetical protein